MGILTNLSLFSGGGGLDLGAKIVGGFRTICYVEKEPYAQGALMSQMRRGALDTAPIWDDVTTFGGIPWHGVVDVVSGGFPCQPHSSVGKRLGGGDERNLWPHYLRIVRECRPRFILAENVDGIFDTYAREVLAGLEREGYCATPISITACEVGAPHMRSRVFFLAHAKSLSGSKTNSATNENGSLQRAWMGHICRSWKEMARNDWPIPSSWVLRDIDGLEFRGDRTRLTGNGVVPPQSVPAWQKILELAGSVR